MFRGSSLLIAVSCLLSALSSLPLTAQASAPSVKRITGEVVPGAVWQETSPESVGFSSAKLEAIRAWVKTQETGSMMVIVQGRVIFSYGDVAHTSKIASVRKSVLDMLYGADAFKDKINDIDLNKTVKQLGLDDKVPFLPIEEKATLLQLMAARSGIYIPSGDEDQAKTLPPRGSEYPGSHYLYNNWDFNAAGTAFEKLTGKDIFQALQDDLAKPIGMQDFVLSKQKKELSPRKCAPGVRHVSFDPRHGAARAVDAGLRSMEWQGCHLLRLGPLQHVSAHTFSRHQSNRISQLRRTGALGLRPAVVGVGRADVSRQHLYGVPAGRLYGGGDRWNLHHGTTSAGYGGCASGGHRQEPPRLCITL